MNETESPTVSPTLSPTTTPELPITVAPSASPTTTVPELPVTTTPSVSPTSSPTEADINVIRLPDYTKPKSVDSVFIVVPVLLLVLLSLVCCQRKAKQYRYEKNDGDYV